MTDKGAIVSTKRRYSKPLIEEEQQLERVSLASNSKTVEQNQADTETCSGTPRGT